MIPVSIGTPFCSLPAMLVRLAPFGIGDNLLAVKYSAWLDFSDPFPGKPQESILVLVANGDLITTNVTMYSRAGMKLSTANMSSTLQSVKAACEQTFPNLAYEYKFLDDKIESFYKQEDQLSQLYKTFAVIALLLSALGLYGLSFFMAVQRIKEVGIRKMLGASVANILYIFSKEFVILISLAFMIAAPVTCYCMYHWLQGYVYRINISGWMFLAGGVVAISIALATISFQAIKAATANPVKSLRSE